MQILKPTLILIAGFFSPTLLIVLMFYLFGLDFRPNEGGAIILTILGLLMAVLSFGVWIFVNE